MGTASGNCAQAASDRLGRGTGSVTLSAGASGSSYAVLHTLHIVYVVLHEELCKVTIEQGRQGPVLTAYLSVYRNSYAVPSHAQRWATNTAVEMQSSPSSTKIPVI